MAYSTNIYLPRVRRNAVNLVVFEGWSCERAARHVGVHRITIWRWCRRAEAPDRRKLIVTRPSTAHSHPWTMPEYVVRLVLAIRDELKRCALIIHGYLRRFYPDIVVSLSTVGRILQRHQLTDRWYGRRGKTARRRTPRPRVEAPGSFMQMDTIHFKHWRTKQAYYVYTLIDLKSRWAYAEYSPQINPRDTTRFVKRAIEQLPFTVQLIQTDNGQEFSTVCEVFLSSLGIAQRRIRLGKKNDNAHIERFNRTLQDECLGRWPDETHIQERLRRYLDFYNTKRLHCSLQSFTPAEVVAKDVS